MDKTKLKKIAQAIPVGSHFFTLPDEIRVGEIEGVFSFSIKDCASHWQPFFHFKPDPIYMKHQPHKIIPEADGLAGEAREMYEALYEANLEIQRQEEEERRRHEHGEGSSTPAGDGPVIPTCVLMGGATSIANGQFFCKTNNCGGVGCQPVHAGGRRACRCMSASS